MSQNCKRSHQSGFTLIELLLAMAGISFILLFVVFGIVHMTGLYTKGVAIRDINQSGRQLIEDISRQLRFGGRVRIVSPNRVCIGDRGYVWNPYGATDNRYDDAANGNPPVRLVVVSGASYCDNPALNIPANAENLVGKYIDLRELSIIQPIANEPVYDIKAVFATSGGNAPAVSLVSGANVYECSPQFGQFCAFGEFNTTVYARRTN